LDRFLPRDRDAGGDVGQMVLERERQNRPAAVIVPVIAVMDPQPARFVIELEDRAADERKAQDQIDRTARLRAQLVERKRIAAVGEAAAIATQLEPQATARMERMVRSEKRRRVPGNRMRSPG